MPIRYKLYTKPFTVIFVHTKREIAHMLNICPKGGEEYVVQGLIREAEPIDVIQNEKCIVGI